MHEVYFLSIFIISGYNALVSNYMTRRTIRQSTWSKPTTFLRRNNVESEEVSATSEFQDDWKQRNKSTTSVWSWDSWCYLQAKEGKCEGHLKRFYYDTKRGECKSFYFSGCDENKNNFESITDCERYCKGSQLLEDTTQFSHCHLQPDEGLCLAMKQKYYYDINEKICKKFTYGGCGGNRNKFDTLFSCMRECNQFKS